jgi:4-amino-4-deoxy-L-arabinose transferase-like glycosyltransferase
VRVRTRTEEISRVFSTGSAVFAVSILITILFWTILPARFALNESVDNREFYEPVARNILQGKGITLRDSPFIKRPPGHSLFLAGIFKLADLFTLPERVVISTVILVCTGLSALFLFIFAHQLWGALPAALSALVWITYLPALWFTKQLNNEVPFLVFFYAGFACFWTAVSHKHQSLLFYLCSGFFIGIAMLIRPIALGVGVIMSFVVWLVKRKESMCTRWTIVAMVLLGNLLAVLPWELWVYAKTGEVVLLTRGGTPNMDDGLMFAILGNQL